MKTGDGIKRETHRCQLSAIKGRQRRCFKLAIVDAYHHALGIDQQAFKTVRQLPERRKLPAPLPHLPIHPGQRLRDAGTPFQQVATQPEFSDGHPEKMHDGRRRVECGARTINVSRRLTRREKPEQVAAATLLENIPGIVFQCGVIRGHHQQRILAPFRRTDRANSVRQ